jgi:hypothetical protein
MCAPEAACRSKELNMTLSRQSLALALALSLPLALVSPASAQSEPTIDQVYQAANTGRLADADKMIEQVLASHPNSAKAHFVKAELAARESNAAVARSELAKAEKLAPGLPFAKPEAVQALRSEVNSNGRLQTTPSSNRSEPMTAATAPSTQGRQLPLATIAVVFALLAAGIYLLVRRRNPAPELPIGGPYTAGPAEAQGPGVPAGVPSGMPQGYAPAYPGGGYQQQQPQPWMGSTLGRGLATGLAVGAGVVAAQEIGHRLFDQHGQPLPPAQSGALPESERGLLDPGVNPAMGGQDFGINDAGSWDSGSGSDAAGGDWDT